jgi:regulator of protease activity HflC (stomatin/prohibitin superfamily)
MLWIIVTIIIGLVGLACLIGGSRPTVERDARRGLLAASAVMFLIWIVVTVFQSTVAIGAGEVGVVRQFGSIVGQEDEGIAIIAPWRSVDTVSIRTQRAEFNDLTAASAETQNVFLDVTVNYSVSESAVQDLLRNVGSNWFDVLIPARVANFTKQETAKWSTADIVPNREVIRRAVQTRLQEDLKEHSITVSDFLIRDISFEQEYLDAIESKQVATEQALRELELVDVATNQAEQRRQEAQGIADANEIEARGQAEANRLINESLTPELVQWQAIQRLADNVTVALIPSGEGILLDPSTMLAPTTTAP